MDVEPVIRFLHTIKLVWSGSNNEEAKDRAEKLSNVLKKGKVISQKWESDMKCDAPEQLTFMNMSKKTNNPLRQRRGSLFPGALSIPSSDISSKLPPETKDITGAPKDVKSDLELSSFSQSNFASRQLYLALAEAMDTIPWKHPKQLDDSISDILGGADNFKTAMIVGTRKLGSIIESDEIYVGLIYLTPGATYPQHAHDAIELYYTLLGSAMWGPTLRHLTTVKPGNFVLHESAQPHTFKVPEKSSPLLAVYCWTGDIAGDYWFCSDKGNFSFDHPISVGEDILPVENYYDQIASDYESMVRSWGYYMPEMVISSLLRYGRLDTSQKTYILDLGCGDGLCGYLAEKEGLNAAFSGVDISIKMLEIAKKKGCYESLSKLDINHKLPFPSETFDYLICCGVTNHLIGPKVFDDWLRLLKPDGIICFTHIDDVWKKWEPYQANLSVTKAWKELRISRDMYFMPSCDRENTSVRCRIYVYQKLLKQRH